MKAPPQHNRRLRVLAAVLAAALLGCGAGDNAAGDQADDAVSEEQTSASRDGASAASPGVATPGGLQAEGAPSTGAGDTSASDAPTAADSAWRQGNAAPLALTEVAAAPFAGAAWTAGGLNAEGVAVSAVQVYDPTFDAWSEGPALPQAVHHSALVSAGDRLYVLGGYEGSGFDTPTAEVAVLQASTGQWQAAPSLPEARAAGAAAWDGRRLVYAGGVGFDGPADDVWALEGGSWTRVGTLSRPREHLAAASDGDGRVWFMGGRTGGLDTNLATVDVVDGGEVAAAGALPTARGGVSGFYAGSGIGACAAGGEGPDGTFAAVECIDPAGGTTVLAELSVPRHGIGAVVLDGIAMVLLGGPEPGLTVSDTVEMLRLAPTGG